MMEDVTVRTDPDDQRARGLSPDEQRAERERESRQTETTKFEQLAESEADEGRRAAEALAMDPVLDEAHDDAS
jgi:hypothetical protein